MSGRESWKGLDETVPAADESIQKELGMTSAGWRDAMSRYRCARLLSWKARSRAEIFGAAAADAGDRVNPAPSDELDPYIVGRVKFSHELLAKRYFDIAEAHRDVAERARAQASDYARTLITKLTARLVQQRLATLDPETVARITRLFGADLTNRRTRARIFEVCDWLCFEGVTKIVWPNTRAFR